MGGGGSAVGALLIAAALIAVGLLIRSILGLCAVLGLNADSKAGRLLKVKAVVKRSVRAKRGGSLRAIAEYAAGERKIPNGRMIGSSTEHLNDGQTIRVLVSKKNPRCFAVNEQQIKASLLSYVILCLMFLVIAAFLIFMAADYITSG